MWLIPGFPNKLKVELKGVESSLAASRDTKVTELYSVEEILYNEKLF